MSELLIFIEGEQVGSVRADRSGRLSLTYETTWRESPQGYSLSVSMPLAQITYSHRAVRAGVWILPTHADDCLTLPLGYGRTHAGPVGNGVGFDAYPLRTSESPWFTALQVRRTGGHRLLVLTQHHARMEGRHIVRSATATTVRP